MSTLKYDYLVVGAGFSGSVCAQQLAENGKTVLLIDKRNHIGGNAYDKYDEHGVLIHPYGPHIFHTNSNRIFKYLSRFTNWRFYEHRVLAQVNGEKYPIPINKTTINRLYKLNLDETGVENYLKEKAVARKSLLTSEDVVLSSVGHDLCEKFFRGYTKKQWGLDLSDLSAGVAARIPTRTNDDDRYFSDQFQFMPADGYTRMFEKMLNDTNIKLMLGTTYDECKSQLEVGHLIYTGPIDEFFDFKYGKLPYRSLKFEHQHSKDSDFLQEVGTVNYPNDYEFTRITEFKHLTGQVASGSSTVKEYPCSDGEPYYPIPRPENDTLYKKYEELASSEKNVTFVGRLAQYRYYNMDQVVAAALVTVERILKNENH